MDLSKSKILVTGSSGTIGNCLCETLLDTGADIVGIDIRKNIWNGAVHLRTRYFDLRNSDNLENFPDDFDAVVHLAANARVYNLVQEPDLARDNFITLYNVLEYTRKSKIKNFLFSSSREVYGNSGYIIHSEDEAFVKNCESNYTATKIAGEALIHSYNQCYDIDFIITRFSNVYGRYDYSDRVIPLFISKALRNEDIHIYGRDKILDFTYIEDTVAGVINSLERFEIARNELYNIATQKGYSIEHVAKIIIEKTQSKSRLVFQPSRLGEVTRFVANIDKARAILDYSPEYSLESGIASAIDWYRPRIDDYIKSI